MVSLQVDSVRKNVAWKSIKILNSRRKPNWAFHIIDYTWKNEYKLCYLLFDEKPAEEIIKVAFFDIALNLFFVPATLNRFHHWSRIYSGIDSGVLVSILPPKN